MLRFIVVIALLFSVVVNEAVASSVFEGPPKDHWAHEAVKQLDCDWCPATAISEGRHSVRPESRYDFAVVTARVYEALLNNEEAISSITSEQLLSLMRLIDEFRCELTAIGLDSGEMKRNLISVLRVKRPGIFIQVYPELAEMSEDHWAYDSMRRLYESGILVGYSKQTDAS